MPLIHARSVFAQAVVELSTSEESLESRLSSAYKNHILHANNDGTGPSIPSELFSKIQKLQANLSDIERPGSTLRTSGWISNFIREIVSISNELQRTRDH